jgi:hypothetical protein
VISRAVLKDPVAHRLHSKGGAEREHTDDSNPVFNTGRARALAAGRPLLAAAQEAHEIRTDLTLEQILDTLTAIAKIDGDPRYVEPIFQATLDALRPPPTTPSRTARP